MTIITASKTFTFILHEFYSSVDENISNQSQCKMPHHTTGPGIMKM
jgi:hypothetical protein